ncbi:hypothetical protein cyc_03282 [Cyclospora cayetanensis]|uniref:Uncharacterized protein n=1 Tax=Cyclospora cayetanensis TaxID=88456 RepID=A0A1D3CQY4_9EIME|nr:hypothetical protein cyc_03282 [Cyclospora cayetanensis]
MDGPYGGGNSFLHTCLERCDFMAFFAELPKTSNLFVRDRGGRTVMELAMHMAADLFQSCFSTSFPIDSSAFGKYMSCSCAVCSHRRHRGMRDGQGENEKIHQCKNPMRVRYNEEYINMYLQPKQMRLNSKLAPAGPSFPATHKYTPTQYPPGWNPTSFPLPSGALASVPGPCLPQQYFYPCEAEDESAEGGKLALEQVKLENRMVQREVLVLVEDVCTGPLCDTMKARMRRLLKKLRSLMLVMKRLGACYMLRIKATEAAVDGNLLQQKITYPFLYSALLHKAFKLYPNGPRGQAFDPLNPADGRRMIQLLVNYQLPGYELALFLGNLTSIFSEFVSFFAQDDVRIWRPGRELQQFYLHMAFALDNVDIFKFIVNYGQLFAGPTDIFKWEDLLYALMEHRDKFRPYFSSLLSSRLKSRVQKRLVEEGTASDIKMKFPAEPVKYPCEERLLTQKVLSEYGSLFGKEEAKELSELLRRWRYGAARPEIDRTGKGGALKASVSSAPQAFWC